MTATALLRQLVDGDRHARDGAFDRIAESTDPALLEPLAELARPGDQALEALLCRFLRSQPFERAEPHLRRLLDSPNAATRQRAGATLEAYDIEPRLGLLLELLTHQHADVVCRALKAIGQHRRSAGIDRIAALLESPDETVVAAAFEALRRIDQARAARPLVAHLERGSPERQIAALAALSEMESFERWKRFLPCLQSPDAGVRLAAVAALGQRGGTRARGHLIARLAKEPDEEVARHIIGRLARMPDRQVACSLLPLAAHHANPQIRRAAGWVVEELTDELLGQACKQLLPGASEEMTAYILTRLGRREMRDYGEHIAAYANTAQPARVLYAALEALGALREPRFLDRVVPFLQSPDAMAAYVATLAAAQMVRRLSDCPALTDLLRRPEGEAVPLKQVVLQYMADAITWDFEDSTLFEILVGYLGDGNENIRYLSTILLGRARGQGSLVEPLLGLALDDASAEVRQMAAQSLDQVLAGDLSPLLDRLDTSGRRHPRREDIVALLPGMRWGAASARRGLVTLDELSDGLDDETRAELARSLFKSDPEACRAFFEGATAGSSWRRALGQAWLDSLAGLLHAEDRTDWRRLFDSGEDALLAGCLDVAADAEAAWAADIILPWVLRRPDHAAAPRARQTVRALRGL